MNLNQSLVGLIWLQVSESVAIMQKDTQKASKETEMKWKELFKHCEHLHCQQNVVYIVLDGMRVY